MTFPRTAWIKMIGLLPTSLLLAPLIAASTLGTVLAIIAWASDKSESPQARLFLIRPLLFFLLLMVSALLGLAGTWASVLMGADQINRKPALRRAVQVSLILGLGTAGYWLYCMGRTAHLDTKLGALTWIVLLIPPIGVGLREFYMLTRRDGPRDPV